MPRNGGKEHIFDITRDGIDVACHADGRVAQGVIGRRGIEEILIRRHALAP